MDTTERPGSIIGSPVPRVDGPLKVSGTAMYTADHSFPGMLYAVPVCATIGNGTIASLDTAAAEKMPGVKAIYHGGNIGKFFRLAPSKDSSTKVDEKRLPFEDDVIRYHGQYVALAVASTLEQAQAAAAAVKVDYHEEKPDVREDLAAGVEQKTKSERGDAPAEFSKSEVQVDQTYTTPAESHAVIEPHATVAVWEGNSVTLYESSQAIVTYRNTMSEMLGIPKENVRAITKFIGSGFGGKLWAWTHCLLAASAARNLGKPVKLVLARKMMFNSAGHRPATQQRLRIGAARDGKLTAIVHDFQNHTSILDDYVENCGEATDHLYSVPNVLITAGLAHRNVGTPTSMRGPGAVPGLFALESALDELAVKLNIDPLELRLRNDAEIDEGKKIPFSSRHLKECFTVGAEKFGWAQRTPGVGSMKKDGVTLGWGVAGASWIAFRFDCELTLDLRADGTARVACGTQDIGTGTYTVIAQMVSEKTGISLEKIVVEIGDSALPPGPTSGGSMATASIVNALNGAANDAIDRVLRLATAGANAPFAGKKPDNLAFAAGRVHEKEKPSESGIPYEKILKAANVNTASASGKSKAMFGDITEPEKTKRSMHSFAAQFAEVSWQPEIARLRLNRVVTVVDAGRIINRRTATNQIQGAVVMGVGMAMFEHIRYDSRNGAPMNSNLADYVLATHADSPPIDVTFIEHPDPYLNVLGARGVGEIGLAGIPAAIASAVYHATGVRVRNLPIKIEDLLVPAATA